MSTPELLPNGNYVNEDGDVLFVDQEAYGPAEAWIPDHYRSEAIATLPRPDDGSASSENKPDIFEDIAKLPQLERVERLVYLKENEGFYPQSNQEFNRMMLMSGDATGNLRALTHLNAVYLHQVAIFRTKEQKEAEQQKQSRAEIAETTKKLTPNEEGQRALRAIVREFEDYAKNAVSERFFVNELKQRIERMDIGNFTAFKNLPNMKDWKDEEGTRRALTLLAKHLEIEAYLGENDRDPLSKKTRIDTAPDKDGRIMEKIGNMRVTDLRRVSSAVASEQTQRFIYWTERLQEATRHSYVRGQGFGALRSLGAIQ